MSSGMGAAENYNKKMKLDSGTYSSVVRMLHSMNIGMAFAVEPKFLLTLLLGGPVLLFFYTFYYVTSLHAKSVDGVKVPRGNFWLFPLLGETISFLSTPPKLFHYKQTRKYGATFTTHIAGHPTIMTSDVELTKWVYQQTNKLFSIAFPKSTCDLLGKESLLFANGNHHLRLRKLIAGPLSTQKLAVFTSTVDKIASEFMASWKNEERVVILDEAKKVKAAVLLFGLWSKLHSTQKVVPHPLEYLPTLAMKSYLCQVKEMSVVVWFHRYCATGPSMNFQVESSVSTHDYRATRIAYILYLAWIHLITLDTQEYPFLDEMLAGLPGVTQIEKLVQLYYTMERGMLTVPLYIPGTRYYKAMNARSKFEKILTKIIADRRSGMVQCEDLLQAMLSPMENGSLLTDAQVMDNIFTSLGAAEISTSTTIVWMVKWIYENPTVHKDLKAELDAIKNNKAEGEQLTYEDTKRMNLTLWTMHETLRLGQVTGPFIGRYANQDVQIKDIAIPKNWKVAMTHRYHLDPSLYPEPEKFNPHRFQTMPEPNTFTPFGQGVRICPGRELAKLEILIFIYHMLTTYSWELAGPDAGIIWYETPHPRNKLPIKVTPLT